MILIDWVCFLNAVHFATIRLWNTTFGGEGLFIATLTGPGPTWLQSFPFSRLAGSIVSAAGGRGKHSEEGSVLGGLGGMLMGSEE